MWERDRAWEWDIGDRGQMYVGRGQAWGQEIVPEIRI